MKKIIRLSVSESASLFGVSDKTIRRAINQNELLYVVVRGRYSINFESLLKWSQQNPYAANKLANEGIGQFVGKWSRSVTPPFVKGGASARWKVKNKLYSPNPRAVDKFKKL